VWLAGVVVVVRRLMATLLVAGALVDYLQLQDMP
jgi:hypothetical protein